MNEENIMEPISPEAVVSRVPTFIPATVIDVFKAGGKQALEDARRFSITTSEEYEAALEFRRQIKVNIERAKKIADPLCIGLDRAHAAACNLRTEMIGGYVNADAALNKSQQDFIAARKKAESELKERQAREAREREEESRRNLADELKAAGAKEEAKAVMAAPMSVVPPQTPSLVPKLKGSSIRPKWEATVTDIVALAKFVGENPLFRHFVAADLGALKKYAADTEGKTVIPGVEFACGDTISVRKK